jgi:hypothetical protein
MNKCTPEEYEEALKAEVHFEEFETHDRTILVSFGEGGEILAIARYEFEPPFAARIKRWCVNAKKQ